MEEEQNEINSYILRTMTFKEHCTPAKERSELCKLEREKSYPSPGSTDREQGGGLSSTGLEEKDFQQTSLVWMLAALPTEKFHSCHKLAAHLKNNLKFVQ